MGFSTTGAPNALANSKKGFVRNTAFPLFLAYQIMVFLPFPVYLFAYHRDWLWMYSADTRMVSLAGLITLLTVLFLVGLAGFVIGDRIISRNPKAPLWMITALWLLGLLGFTVSAYRSIIFYGDYNTYKMIAKYGAAKDIFARNIFESPLFPYLLYFTAALALSYIAAMRMMARKGE